MKEYLYIDKVRLDSYFNQIASPVHYDKIPVWKVAIGFTGTKVESTQTRQGRDVTTEEKIQRFEEHIVSNKLVLEHREDVSKSQKPVPFVIEILEARRVFIRSSGHSLNMWIVQDEKSGDDICDAESNLLLLIEDYNADDDDPHTRPSSGTVLQMLDSELCGSSAHGIIDKLDKTEFQIDLLQTLEKANAHIGEPRMIRVIYRLRATIYDKYTNPVTRGFVGYPIVITEE